MISNTWTDGTLGAWLLGRLHQARDRSRKAPRPCAGPRATPSRPALTPCPAARPHEHGQPGRGRQRRRLPPALPALRPLTTTNERLGATAACSGRCARGRRSASTASMPTSRATREEQYLEAPSFSVGGACTAANLNTTVRHRPDSDVTVGDHRQQQHPGRRHVQQRRPAHRKPLRQAGDQVHPGRPEPEQQHHRRHQDRRPAGPLQVRPPEPDPDHGPVRSVQRPGLFLRLSRRQPPKIDYGSAALTDPASWVLTQIRERPAEARSTPTTPPS